MKRALHRRRGRPPKFGRPGRVVAVTLPEEVVRGLKRVHGDLGWAIVQLFQQQRAPRAAPRQSRRRADSELVSIANGRSLIVVSRDAFKALPGISLIPLDADRAFLALDHDAGVADLELAVVDRLARPSVGARERTALAALRAQLRRWRHDPQLQCRLRSIIVIERGASTR
jgi:hypothetical protein